MQRQHRHAHPGDVLDALGDRVVDVEQLHVEEDLRAAAGELAGEVEAAGEGELVADLVEGDDAVEVAHHRLGLAQRRHVEADDQPVSHACSRPARHGSTRVDSIAARSISVRHTVSIDLRSRSSLKSPSSSKASPPCGDRALRRDHLHLAVHQHGAQMVEAAHAGEIAVGGRAQAADLAGERLNGWPPSLRTRLTQSIVFFSSGGIEALYSGLAISSAVMGGDQARRACRRSRERLSPSPDPGP